VNDQTLKQLAQWLQAEHGMQVGVTTLWRTLARLKLSLKKMYGPSLICKAHFL
jgi:transposase